MQKARFARYNDGIVAIYREIEARSNFGARINPTNLEDLDFVAKLAYSQETKRQQDIEFAEQQGFSLSLKIRTRLIAGIDNKCKAVISGYLYDIKFVDSTRTDSYIYMEGVCEIA